MEAGLLWLHVVSGVIWIGACAALAIGSATLGAGSAELTDFAARAVPALTRLAMLAAAIVLLSGGAKFATLGLSIDFRYRAEFLTVLAAKAALFVAMAAAMVAAQRAAAAMPAAGSADHLAAMKRVGQLAAATVVMGAAALGLGMWLAGAA